MEFVAKILKFNYKYVFRAIWPFSCFFEKFKKVTDVWLFLGPRTFVWNTDILCDDPQFFFSQYFLKNKFSRDVWLKFLNFDFFTNKTVEWPKFALFYMSFWPVSDSELAAGVTPVTTENLWKGWFLGVPKGSRYNTSPSGWFTGCIYSDWFHKSWLPTVQRRPGKHVLIGDNLSSHISVDVINT